MNNRRLNISPCIYLLHLILLFVGCNKTEYMPVPIGEPSQPAEEISYEEAIDQPSFSLFRTAMERSSLKEKLTNREKGSPLTILIPDNPAFEKAGINLQTIQTMDPKQLDSLLAYHILNTRVDRTTFAPFIGSATINTWLTHGTLKDKSSIKPYIYTHGLSITDDQLMVDGKSAGKENPIFIKNGTLWPINRVLDRPMKFMYDVLREDGRFSIFLDMCERNDLVYTKNINRIINEDIMGIIDEEEFGDYWREFSEFVPSIDQLTINPKYNSVNRFTLLAPTDDAFRKAGFQTAEAFAKLNKRATLPRYMNSYKFYTASDSILINHWFGGRYYLGGDQSQITNPLVFFSGDLNNNILGRYKIFYEGRNSDTGEIEPALLMPLDFSVDATKAVKISVKGSSHTANLIESDINTMNGPIHVVDNLLIPKGFKLTP